MPSKRRYREGVYGYAPLDPHGRMKARLPELQLQRFKGQPLATTSEGEAIPIR